MNKIDEWRETKRPRLIIEGNVFISAVSLEEDSDVVLRFEDPCEGCANYCADEIDLILAWLVENLGGYTPVKKTKGIVEADCLALLDKEGDIIQTYAIRTLRPPDVLVRRIYKDIADHNADVVQTEKEDIARKRDERHDNPET